MVVISGVIVVLIVVHLTYTVIGGRMPEILQPTSSRCLFPGRLTGNAPRKKASRVQ